MDYQTPNQNQYNYSPGNRDPYFGYAIASLVLGIVSFFVCGLPLGIAGVVLAVIAKRNGCTSGLATAGLVISIVGVVFTAVMLIFNILGLAFGFALF